MRRESNGKLDLRRRCIMSESLIKNMSALSATPTPALANLELEGEYGRKLPDLQLSQSHLRDRSEMSGLKRERILAEPGPPPHFEQS